MVLAQQVSNHSFSALLDPSQMNKLNEVHQILVGKSASR